MMTQETKHQGGDAVVSLTGVDFERGASALLVYRDCFPDGRVAGGPWQTLRSFDAAGEYRFNVPPALVAFDIPELAGKRPDVAVSLTAAAPLKK